jgi:hypothetical protein
LKWPPIGGAKKITWNDPPLVAKKQSFEVTHHWRQKQNIWPTIDNQKKIIRVTPSEAKKIHWSDPHGLWKNTSLERTWSEIFFVTWTGPIRLFFDRQEIPWSLGRFEPTILTIVPC